MTVLLPWFALVVTVLAGWAIIKRLSTSMVLLFAGLAMISFAVICGVHGFLPKGVKPSGFVWFDIFELLRSIATKQTSGIGLLIMVAGGYAAYMDRIGAAHALVRVCVKPLDALSSPYLVLVMGYLIGQALVHGGFRVLRVLQCCCWLLCSRFFALSAARPLLLLP